MFLLCKYNTATTIYFPMIKRGVVDLAVTADWTPAVGDTNISKDGGAQANPAGTVAISTGATWKLALSGTELSAAEVQVMIVDSATKAVEDQWITIYTYGNASAKFIADISLANLPANVAQLLGTAWLTPGTAGTPDVNVKLINAQTASAAAGVTFPSSIASPTNITAAAGCAVSSLGANVITAASIADAAIDNATFAADVGSTAIATNVIGIASQKGTVAALNVDTYAEPAQGTPAATATLVSKIGFLYKSWRNRKTQTSTQWNLFNDDAVTIDHKATVADDATTASKTEIATGP